jgi:inosine-uridine nucleoside N-ribohydrolase
MPRKVIIDCDPGIDDAFALALALFDPRLEVLAVTACSGTVEAERSTRNIQSIIEQLDPPRHPRIGAASEPDNAPIGDGRSLHGVDGLGGSELPPVGRQHVVPSEKLISDSLRANPGEVTLLCLGPLTGIARAFQRDPALHNAVDRIVISGGALNGIGDITPVAEFNMHFDPESAAMVLKSPTTKTLLPLEVSNQLSFGLDLIDQLPPKYTRVGGLLHPMLPYFFRVLRQTRAQETASFKSLAALLLVTEPMLFESQEQYVEIEEHGDLTRGLTFFDQRGFGPPRRNCEVVSRLDIDTAYDCIHTALRFAGQSSGEVM